MMKVWQFSYLMILSHITGTHGGYTVTLKAGSKAWAGTSHDIIINVRGPDSSTPGNTMDGVPNNEEKSVDINTDVGLPSCVTARNTGDNGLLISWIKISSSSYDDVKFSVDEWIEKGKQEEITKCRFYCPAAYGKEGEVCRKCRDNTYSDGYSTNCKNCHGTQTSGVGATTCTPVKCNGGYRVGGHTCNKCPKNTYSQGDTSTTCTECKDNEISGEGASSCKPVKCNSGHRVGGHACNKCPKNTYSKGGYSVTCTECEDNESSDEGASACYRFTCNSGYRVGGHTCNKCTKNSYSKGGYSVTCISCKDNESSDEGGSACNLLSCKDGEKADEHKCSTCPENTFAVQGDTTCTKCGDNQNSTAGSGKCTGFCTSLPGEWNVTTELNTTLYEGDTISLKCAENYTNIGSGVVTCARGETYNFSKTPKCAEDCTELPDLEHMDRNRTNEKVPTPYNSKIPLSCRSGYISAGALHCGPNGTFSKQNATCTKINTDIIAERKIKKAYVVYGTSSAGGIILCIVFILFLIIIIRKRRRQKKEGPPTSGHPMEMNVVVNDCNSDVYDTLERSPEQRKARAGKCIYTSINISATPRHAQAPDDDTYNVPFPENKEEEEEEDYDANTLYTAVVKIKKKAHPESTADDDQYSMPLHKNRSRGSQENSTDKYSRLCKKNTTPKRNLSYNIPEHDDDVYNIPDYNDDVYNIPEKDDDVYNIPDAQTNNHSSHYDDGELYNTLNRNGLSRLPQIDDETYNVLSKDRKPSSPKLCVNDEMYSTLSK